MPVNLRNNWDIGESSAQINIGTHKLWVTIHGPDRKFDEPLVIIIPGLAGSTTGWAAVQRELCTFTRVLQYDRSGYGQSDCSNEKPTASTIARELDLLLRNANLLPPYVVVAHSWGGILSREFLALRPKDIVGMVFVDANQEHTLEVLDWRQLISSDLLIGVDHFEATGILHAHKLTSDEWRIYQETQSTEKHRRQADLEAKEYPNSFPVLESKCQLHGKTPLLGDHPVCVIKGDTRASFEKLLNAGLARGNRDDAKLATFQETLRTWDEKDRSLQSEILLLSTNSHYMEAAKNSGHDLHLTEPQLIVEGVGWVLSEEHKSRK